MGKRIKRQNLVHLHSHDEFSFLDSVVSVKGLGRILRVRGFNTYAQTNHGNLNGSFQLVKDLKGAEIKSILGIEFYLVPDRFRRGLTEEEKKKIKEKYSELTNREALKIGAKDYAINDRYHLVALAKNNIGWRKLIRAVEISHQEGFYRVPRIDFDIVYKLAPDCVILSACLSGVPAKLLSEGKRKEAIEWSGRMVETFGDDFNIEIQPNDIQAQVEVNPQLISLAEEVGAKVVASNDVHYLDTFAYKTHDILLALRESQGRKRVLVSDTDRFKYPTNQLYLKSRFQMEKSFTKFHPDISPAIWKAALDRTVEIADQIEDNVLEFRKAVLPPIKVKGKLIEDPNEYLWGLVRDGWKWRKVNKNCKGKMGFIDWIDGKEPEEVDLKTVYKERVKYEMEEITRMGFARYFLVIYDLVSWARNKGIRVGPGRGSVGGSIVAFFLGITSVDSIRFNCPFSRFISPDRIDYPDIDLDFPTNERERIKGYLRARYGASRVAGICTFGRMKGKMVLKDIARVFDVDWHETEKVTRLVIQRPDGDERASDCLEDTFKEFPEMNWYKNKYPEVVKHAQSLEGNVRHLGVHAAGLVVSDQPLRNLVPVQFKRRGKGEAGEYLTGWDKKEVEAVGLLKLDLLGIEGLTYIQRCLDLIKQRTGKVIEPEIDLVGLDDKKVYESFRKGQTELVWQMNQFGAIQILKRLKPTLFEHLVATTSLIRPGPQNAGITDEYIKRKNGGKSKSLAPILDEMLKASMGLFVFQEDVIKTVHDIGGFTWGEADRIRKDIGKKKGVEYLQKTYLDRFVSGAAEHDIEREAAVKIWAQISEFGLYGFNRAHATGYSLLSYWTMYLKIHHPLEFMCAALEAEKDADKKRRYVKEARRLKISIIQPDVNVSGLSYTIDDRIKNTIRAGLVDVKGAGTKTVEKIIAGAPYSDLQDFILRSKANKTVIKAFLRIGALDTLCDNPKQIEVNLEAILKIRKLKKWKEYWEALELEESKMYTGKEREKYRFELASIPSIVHPATTVVDWLTERCEHITWNRAEDFGQVLPIIFGGNHAAFIGMITKVKFYSDSKKKGIPTEESDSENTAYENRTGRIILEDESGQIAVRVSATQLAALGADNIKEGKLFAAIGQSIGDNKLGAGMLVDLTELMSKVEAEEAGVITPGFDLQEQFIFGNPLSPFRKWLDDRSTLKPIPQVISSRGTQKTCITIVAIEKRFTLANKKMAALVCCDWLGNIVDVPVFPDDYERIISKVEVGGQYILRCYGRLDKGDEKRNRAKVRRLQMDTRSNFNPLMSFEKYYTKNGGK